MESSSMYVADMSTQRCEGSFDAQGNAGNSGGMDNIAVTVTGAVTASGANSFGLHMQVECVHCVHAA